MKNLSADLRSGLVISLIALPLSIGISLASGAPAAAGLWSAIVGGILGSLLGGSELTINGAAAGLIVVVIQGIALLGHGDAQIGFQRFLASVVLAGGFQVVLGLLRVGGIALAVPTSVIHGMLMGIGVIIMAKQSHVILGVVPHHKEILELIAEIPHSLMNLNPIITLIGVSAMVVFLGWPKLAPKSLRGLPAALVAAVWAMALGAYFDLEHEHTVGFFAHAFVVGPNSLLDVPSNLAQALTRPDFSGMFSWVGLQVALTVALVASIESILSAHAVDRIDPLKRKSNFNRELVSKGACNMLLGLIGGLPIIAEIVRSSANVNSGATSRWSNFFHGVFVLAFLLLIPGILHRIPLTSLAAILAVVGYRLANPAQLKHVWHVGWDQTVVFLCTLILTVAVDLLVAVIVGIVLEIGLNLWRSRSPFGLFRIKEAVKSDAHRAEVLLSDPLVFTNVISLKQRLDRFRRHETFKEVHLNLEAVPLVDHTVMELLHHSRDEFESEGKCLSFAFSASHRPSGIHTHSSRALPLNLGVSCDA